MQSESGDMKEIVVARDDIFWQELSVFLQGTEVWSNIFFIDGSVRSNVSLDVLQQAFSLEKNGQCFRHHLLGDFSKKDRADYRLVLLENYMLQMRRLNDQGVDVLPFISREEAGGSYAPAIKGDSFLNKILKSPPGTFTPEIELRWRLIALGYIEFNVRNRVTACATVKHGMLKCIMKLPDDERLATLQLIFDVTGNKLEKMMFLPEEQGSILQPSIDQKNSSLHETYNAYLVMKRGVMSKAKFVERSELKSVMPVVMPDRKEEELTALGVFDAACQKETVDRLFVAAVKDDYKPELLSAYFSLLLDLRGNGAPRHELFEKGSPMAHLVYRLFENPKYEKPLKQLLAFVETLYQEKILGPSQGADSLLLFLQKLYVKYNQSFPVSRLVCAKLFVSLYEAGCLSDIDSEVFTTSLPVLPSSKSAPMLRYLLLYFQLPTTYPEKTNYCLKWAQELFEEIQRQKPAEKAKLIQMMLNPKTSLGEYFLRAEHLDKSVLQKARKEYAVMLADHNLKKANAGAVVEEKRVVNIAAIRPYFLAFYEDMPELAKEFESKDVMAESDVLKHLETISLTHHENIGYYILSKVLVRDELDLTPVQVYFDLLSTLNSRKGDAAFSARVEKLTIGAGFRLPGASTTLSFDLMVVRALEHVLYYQPKGIKIGKVQQMVINKNKEQIIPLLRSLVSLSLGDKLMQRLLLAQEKLFDVMLGMEGQAYLKESFLEGSALHTFFSVDMGSISFLEKKGVAVSALIGNEPFKQLAQYESFLNQHCPEEKCVQAGAVVTMNSVLERLKKHKVIDSLIKQGDNPIAQSLGVDKLSNLLFVLASSGFKYNQDLLNLVLTLARAIVVSDNWEFKANNLIFLQRLISHDLLATENFHQLFSTPFKTSSRELNSYINFLLPHLLKDKGEGDRPEELRVVFALAQLPLPKSVKTSLKHLQIRLFNYIVYERDLETLKSIEREEKTPLNSFLMHTSSFFEKPTNFPAAANKALVDLQGQVAVAAEMAEEEDHINRNYT